MSPLLLLQIVKPTGGWSNCTLEAINCLRSTKNTVYSDTSKCWISDAQYENLENTITKNIAIILKDNTIKFSPEFKTQIHQWMVKTKELMLSRDIVLKYLQSEMKDDLNKIQTDQQILLQKADRYTELLTSIFNATAESRPLDFEHFWKTLEEWSWRRFKNPIFNEVNLMGPLQKSSLTLIDLWRELDVLGKGWLAGEISLVYEKFLVSSQREWHVIGGHLIGKTSFAKKICLQCEVFYPEKLVLLITDHIQSQVEQIKNGENSDDNLTNLINANVFGDSQGINKSVIAKIIQYYSDCLLFVFDGFQAANSRVYHLIKNCSALKSSKLVLLGCQRTSVYSTSIITGISQSNMYLLLEKYLRILTKVNIRRRRKDLIRMCDAVFLGPYKYLLNISVILQLVVIVYVHYKCQACPTHSA